MTDLSKWTFNGLLSTTNGPNRNQIGASEAYSLLSNSDPFDPQVGRQIDEGGLYVNSNLVPDNLCNIDDWISAAASGYGSLALITMSANWGFMSKPGDRRFVRFFYRYPGFVTHCHYGTGGKPNAFLRLAWAVSTYLCTRKGPEVQDSWMQTDLMARTYLVSGHRTWLCDLALKYWLKKRPKPIWQLCADYIGTEDHPLVQAWKAVELS